MKLVVGDYLAFVVAAGIDLFDYIGGFVPYLGDILDVLGPLIYGALLKDKRALIGMTELASLFPPALFLDFIPIHIFTVLYILREKSRSKK